MEGRRVLYYMLLPPLILFLLIMVGKKSVAAKVIWQPVDPLRSRYQSFASIRTACSLLQEFFCSVRRSERICSGIGSR
jgi:hypothetical protein